MLEVDASCGPIGPRLDEVTPDRSIRPTSAAAGAQRGFGLTRSRSEPFVIGADASWLAKSKLTPTDRRQLGFILGGTKPPVTLERALVTAPVDLFTGELAGFGEHPVEWHDVLDQVDVVQFQLWLYFGDRGVLLKAATPRTPSPFGHSSKGPRSCW